MITVDRDNEEGHVGYIPFEASLLRKGAMSIQRALVVSVISTVISFACTVCK